MPCVSTSSSSTVPVENLPPPRPRGAESLSLRDDGNHFESSLESSSSAVRSSFSNPDDEDDDHTSSRQAESSASEPSTKSADDAAAAGAVEIKKIKRVHAILHRDVLEVFAEPFVLDDRRRIGLRCRFCKHLPRGSAANLSTIYPKSVEWIYRAGARFQKHHLGSCQYIPEAIKAELRVLGGNDKSSSSRGGKSYWVESALRLGFRTIPGERGVIFCPEIPASLHHHHAEED